MVIYFVVWFFLWNNLWILFFLLGGGQAKVLNIIIVSAWSMCTNAQTLHVKSDFIYIRVSLTEDFNHRRALKADCRIRGRRRLRLSYTHESRQDIITQLTKTNPKHGEVARIGRPVRQRHERLPASEVRRIEAEHLFGRTQCSDVPAFPTSALYFIRLLLLRRRRRRFTGSGVPLSASSQHRCQLHLSLCIISSELSGV